MSLSFHSRVPLQPSVQSIDLSLRKLIALLLMLPLPVVAALLFIRHKSDEISADRWTAHSETVDAALSPDAIAQGQAIASLTLHPATLYGGQSSHVNVTLRYPAPRGGAHISINADNQTQARLPASITIQPGATSATFKVETSAVARLTHVGLSVAHDGKTQADTLTLLPRARREWYAATGGNAQGNGSKQSPWDLQTALAGGAGVNKIEPGDTLWLRGGLYSGAFTSTLTGRTDAPIIVRAVQNERVVLDRAGVGESKQPALKVRGAWVWFWNLELTNSHPDRSRNSPYTKTDEPWRGSGADIYAPHVKFINCVFHDNGHGIWDKQDMSEVHGCLFYYNGNNKREHALYVGNGEGTKFITDNVVFAQGGYGILAHSDSPKSTQRGLHIEGNACFANGAITDDDQTTGNIQVGGVSGVPAARIVVRNNFVYSPPESAASKSNGLKFGYEDKQNLDLKLLDNYVVARRPLRVWWWQRVECAGNSFITDDEACELLTPEGFEPSSYFWDFNSYTTTGGQGAAFVNNSKTYSFPRWRERTGLDAHSQYLVPLAGATAAIPPRVFVRPNRYEPGRAHIIVFNRGARERVAVELAGILAPGQEFEIRDAQNFYGTPVARGVYDGSSISLPLHLRDVAQPVGRVEKAPRHTSPAFAVFVLLPRTSSPKVR
ncbi:MAG TPA: right-handed parallel beta-helix repeat-containing protein [Pyrinomonadaceae bacterium]|nr:right-handed parallel beta-helix repeat-containing protein [Pyrinomonadaceae bacterium]